MRKNIIVFVLLSSLMLIGSLTLGIGAAPVRVERSESTDVLTEDVVVCGVFPIVKRPDAGRDRRDGFLIAIDEINAQSGSDRILPDGIDLIGIVKDDDNTAEGGTAAANSCVADGADVVIGSSGSSVSAAMHDVLKTLKIVQLSYASSSPTLSDRTTYPYFMRNVASDADQGLALAELADAFGWTMGATINTDDTYGTGLVSVFTLEFEDTYGGTILSAQQFATGASDVSGQVQALADVNPEFVLLNAIDVDAAVVFKEAGELGLTGNANTAWLITDGSSTGATFAGDSTVEAAMNLVLGTNPVSAATPELAAFNATWFSITTCGGVVCEGPGISQSGGTPFNSYAPFAYDAVYIMAKGLAAAGTTDGDALLTALYAVTHTGAAATYVFNDLGEVNTAYNILQLSGSTYSTKGKWEGSLTLNSGSLTLPGDSMWTVSGNKAICDSGCRSVAGAPGFGTVELLFAALSIGVIVTIRRKKD